MRNPDSPLYGRYFEEINVGRFSDKESTEFLRRGFEEAGRDININIINRGVSLFDGIPGWLVHYGISILEGKGLKMQ